MLSTAYSPWRSMRICQFDTEDRGVHPLVRLSPHYYNTEGELDRAIAAVSGLPRG